MSDDNFLAYSEYYDLLYADKDYEGEAEYVLELLNKHASSPIGTMLELGCGTGAHAELFARKGCRVHGIDMSSHMLKRAHQRAATSTHSAKLKFDLGDVRSFRTDGRFDAVISLFHVTSYQTTNADLEAMFETAARHLNPGGVFLFDFWYGPAVLSERPTVRVKRFSNERVSITRIAEPVLEDCNNVVEVQYSISVRKGTDSPVEMFEKHRMRYLFLPELEAMLGKHGFKITASKDWLTQDPPSLKSWGVGITAFAA
jgi:cyclopropane fatty-acyl-phospholipid synthase-like methyltransferase